MIKNTIDPVVPMHAFLHAIMEGEIKAVPFGDEHYVTQVTDDDGVVFVIHENDNIIGFLDVYPEYPNNSEAFEDWLNSHDSYVTTSEPMLK